MAHKKISQWNARQYKRRLEALERQTRNERSCYGQPLLVTLDLNNLVLERGLLRGAQLMHHALACRLDGSYLYIHGVR